VALSPPGDYDWLMAARTTTFALLAALALSAFVLPASAAAKQKRCPASGAGCSLKEVAAESGIFVGTALSNEITATEKSDVAANFNAVTSENAFKWSEMSKTAATTDFATTDRLVAWARAKKLRLRAHTLLWHRLQNAPWLKAELAAASDPAARLRQLIAERITKVVGRYRGKVEIWDVINEPLAIFGAGYDSEDTAVTPKNIFYTTLGEGYIASAFRLARKADPKAKLFLNELLWDARIGDPKSDALLALVARLKKARVPIDGVGIQAHAMLGTSSPWFPSTTASLKRYIDALGKLGVKVEITELDVRLPLLADQPNPLAAQAAVYRRVASACAQARACSGLTVWGVRDSDSWLDSYSLTSATAPNRPLLLDAGGKRKLAYRAVAAGLLERRR
jgi:endo-1,4-beta-xylanase